ncbi:MAG: hypothetical protein AB8B93_20090 [Pseudomonadales bacterium]
MPPRAQTGIDSDLLQADVMRFMAIIAFCLIAILALVRNVEAPAPTTPQAEPAPLAAATPATPAIEIEATVASTPEATNNDTVEQQQALAPSPSPQLAAPTAPEPVAKSVTTKPASLQPIAPAPAPQPQQTISLQELAKPVQSQRESPAAEPLIADRQPTPAPAPAPTESEPERQEDQGLSLRFESDQDFLRLISKRDIEVYLFNQADAHRLSHSYQFATAQPPSQLYEVLAQTIPDAISAAARRDLGSYDRYRWGIAMPGPIEQQILGFVNAAVHGELVIDRYGQVHHVE